MDKLFKTKAAAQAYCNKLNISLFGQRKKYVPRAVYIDGGIMKRLQGWEVVLQYDNVTVTGHNSGILVLLFSLLSLIKYI